MDLITVTAAPGAPTTLANPTDIAICRLLAAGPVPTVAMARQLGVPERTVRYRLSRLRQTGAVVSGSDGLHRQTAPVPTSGDAEPVRIVGVPPPGIAGPRVARDLGAAGLDEQAIGGSAAGGRGRWVPIAILATLGVALAAAAVLGRRSPHSATPSLAAPPDDAIDWERWAVW